MKSLPREEKERLTNARRFRALSLSVTACDIQAAAAVFGHSYVRAEQPAALSDAVAAALRPGAGCTRGGDEVVHRVFPETVGRAEVAPDEPAEIVEKLLRQRPVSAGVIAVLATLSLGSGAQALRERSQRERARAVVAA